MSASLLDPRSAPPRAQDLEDSRTFSALGSAVRMRILNSIATKEKTISELAQELDLNRVTIRYHLGTLRKQGLVEEVSPAGTHRVGRPATLYRAAPHARVPSFPERHFELFGQLAVEALVEAVGKEEASGFLRAKGAEIGRSMVREIGAKARVARWTPDAFEALVVQGLFRDFGIPSEVLSKSPTDLTYRSFGCPFLELAERMPDLVCNALDRGFHEGIDEALDGPRTERVACMGHGDRFCQYHLTWTKDSSPTEDRDRNETRTAVKEHD